MAVYEHNYKPYDGALTPAWSRFLVIPRYVYQDLFKYKLFIALFVLCFVCPLVYTILIYLHHNTSALTFFGVSSADVVPINGFFFKVFTTIQTSLAFIFTVIIGPVLISRDLANNALPLYLCRPFSRWEYIFGKLSVLVILLSVITWVPGLLLFLFQSYLDGGSWMVSNFWIARGIFMVSLVWILTLGLLALAFSAWIRWRTAASAALFAIIMIPMPIGAVIMEIFGTGRGFLFSLLMAYNVMADEFFRTVDSEQKFFSLGEAWMVFLVYGLVCFYMLWRKVRAYEVISS